MIFRHKGFGNIPSSRLDSHRNSVQNGMVERFTAFMATIFLPNLDFYAAATFCPLDGNDKKEQKTQKLQKAGQGTAGTTKLWESEGKLLESARKPSESANSVKIEPERAPEMMQKNWKSLPNGRQQEPQRGGAKRHPLGAVPKAPPRCLPFGK